MWYFSFSHISPNHIMSKKNDERSKESIHIVESCYPTVLCQSWCTVCQQINRGITFDKLSREEGNEEIEKERAHNVIYRDFPYTLIYKILIVGVVRSVVSKT